MSDLSPEMVLWVARRQPEKEARDEIRHYIENPPRLPKIECPRCFRSYYEIGSSNGQCAVCIVELKHLASVREGAA